MHWSLMKFLLFVVPSLVILTRSQDADLPEVKITDIVCTPEKQITLTFDRGTPDLNGTDEYEITMIEYGEVTVLCNTVNITCEETKAICTCEYPGTDHNYPADSDVTFVVNISRGSQYVETREIHNLIEYIRPGPVMRLHTTDVTSTDAHIRFCLQALTARLFRFMYIHGHPLVYHIKVIKTQGFPEEMLLTLPAALNWRCCKCMDVLLSNLTAFTTYDVIISGVGGGGEGPRQLFSFTTGMTAPTQPSEETFRSTRVNLKNNRSALLLMWQPLPHEAQGGPNLTYSVEVTGQGGFQRNIPNIEQMYTLISDDDLPAGPLTAKLWAQNVVDQSENHSTIYIPSKSEFLKPAVHVEFSDNKASAFVQSTDLTRYNVQALTLHSCRAHRDNQWGLEICQEYPRTVTLQFSITDAWYEILDFPLGDRVEDQELREGTRTVTYYYLDWIDSELGTPKTAVAVVRINISDESTATKDFDYEDFGNGEDYNYYIYDYDSRMKREVRYGRGQSLNARQIRTRSLLSVSDNYIEDIPGRSVDGGTYQIETGSPEDTSVTALSYPGEAIDPAVLVFLSAETLSAETLSAKTLSAETLSAKTLSAETLSATSSMFPTSCYYDRTKDFVREPLMSLSIDETQVNLTVEQACDPDKPQQFLADFFDVSTSEDSNCETNTSFIGRLANLIVRPSVISLPRDVQYVCVAVHRNRTSEIPEFTSQPFVKNVGLHSLTDSVTSEYE